MFDKTPIKITAEDEANLSDQNKACLGAYYEQWLVAGSSSRIQKQIEFLNREADLLDTFDTYLHQYTHSLKEGGRKEPWFPLMETLLQTIELLRLSEDIPDERVREFAMTLVEGFVRQVKELLP